MAISVCQEELHDWRMKNFPECTPEDQFMGMVEEMGEMAHAWLKHKQGIRSYAGGATAKEPIAIKDAIADLTIFMMGFCSLMGWDLELIVEATAYNEVMKRDWITYPTNGITE